MNARDKLRATYSKKEKDVILHFPLGYGTSSDGHYLSGIFNVEFTDQLERRGYDLSTMKFSIEPMKGNDRFSSQRQIEHTDK